MTVEFDVNKKQDLMELWQEYFGAKMSITKFLPVNWVTGAENLINFFNMLSPLNWTRDKQMSERINFHAMGGLQQYRF